jgi:hypothetical protein
VAETRLACRIDALDARQRERHAALVAELATAATGVEELGDGYAVRFPSQPYLFLRVAEWVELERACCPFLAIGIAFENGVGSIRVDLRGPAGVKEFLRSQYPSFERVR